MPSTGKVADTYLAGASSGSIVGMAAVGTSGVSSLTLATVPSAVPAWVSCDLVGTFTELLLFGLGDG